MSDTATISMAHTIPVPIIDSMIYLSFEAKVLCLYGLNRRNKKMITNNMATTVPIPNEAFTIRFPI